MGRNKSEHFARAVDRAARQLTPYQQGQFDSLCGLYAILNAIQLAAYPIQPIAEGKARALFETGSVFLRREHGHLHPLARGMSNHVLFRLAQHLATEASTRKIAFSLSRYPGPDDTEYSQPFRDWIEYHLNLGRPVICCLYQPAHCTVISSVSSAQLDLFDSQKLTCLKIPKRDQLTDHLDGDAGIAIAAERTLAGDRSDSSTSKKNLRPAIPRH